MHLLWTCVILPNCDGGSIFYKDIHICTWVNVSMLNSHVLCERPQFKTMMLKHFWGSLLIIIMISAIRITIRFCWVGVLLYVLGFHFLLFIFDSQIRSSVSHASKCCIVIRTQLEIPTLRKDSWEKFQWTTRLRRKWGFFVMFFFFSISTTWDVHDIFMRICKLNQSLWHCYF